jgi:hypothetical protein
LTDQPSFRLAFKGVYFWAFDEISHLNPPPDMTTVATGQVPPVRLTLTGKTQLASLRTYPGGSTIISIVSPAAVCVILIVMRIVVFSLPERPGVSKTPGVRI